MRRSARRALAWAWAALALLGPIPATAAPAAATIAPAAGSSGTITSVTAGTGLTGGGSSGAVTVGDGTSGVTAGSYTDANITVNAQGRVTAAASGSAGIAAALFAPLMSAVPTQTSTGFSTWVNQGSHATVTNAATGIQLQDQTSAGGAFQFRMLTKAAPSTPYTATALFNVTSPMTGYNFAEFGWYDGSAKVQALKIGWANGSYTTSEVDHYTQPNAGSQTVDATATNLAQSVQFIWAELNDNGTNVTFSVSEDGVTWQQVYTIAKSSGYLGSGGYANIFIGVDPYSEGVSLVLMSYSD